MKMNLPNKLTVLRLCLVPVIIVVLLLPVNIVTNILGAFIFLATAITDLLDGKIARARNLVTNFGKFIILTFAKGKSDIAKSCTLALGGRG